MWSYSALRSDAPNHMPAREATFAAPTPKTSEMTAMKIIFPPC